MKFLHLADVHLGVCPLAGEAYTKKREREIWNSFEDVISRCEEEKIDLLLIAGDLFHRQPLKRELADVNFLFSKLSHTRVVLIAGNHDYIRSDSWYTRYEWAKNVYPLFSDELAYVDFPDLGCAVYGLSYYAREIKEPLYDQAKALNLEPFEILLAHGGDATHIPINWSALSRTAFDYVALGHIHMPGTLVPDFAQYAGSLEPTDVGDLGEHGYILGEVSDGRVRTQFVSAATRSYIPLDLVLSDGMGFVQIREELAKKIEVLGKENLFKLRLTGQRMPQLQIRKEEIDVYGNLVTFEDASKPARDFQKLYGVNKDNILGKVLRRMKEENASEIEDAALIAAAEALLATCRDEDDEWN